MTVVRNFDHVSLVENHFAKTGSGSDVSDVGDVGDVDVDIGVDRSDSLVCWCDFDEAVKCCR